VRRVYAIAPALDDDPFGLTSGNVRRFVGLLRALCLTRYNVMPGLLRHRTSSLKCPLRECKPQDLRFSILELVAPKVIPEDVISIESTWKERLHSREFGLKEN
jgi:hypothetical protein